MLHRIGWIACFVMFLGLTGCQPDVPTAGTDATTLTNPPMSVVGECSSYGGGLAYMTCDATFYVGEKGSAVEPDSGELAVLKQAVEKWRDNVFNGDFGIPRMEYTTNENLMDIEAQFQDTGLDAGEWCGNAGSASFELGIVCGTGGSVGTTLGYLALHELSELEVTGFTASPSTIDEVKALCPSIDEKPTDFRPAAPCEWERQRVLDLANVRPDAAAINWNSFLVDELKLSTASSSIAIGDTVDLSLVTVRQVYAFEEVEGTEALVSSRDTVVHPTSAWIKNGPANWVGGQPSGTDRSGTLVATDSGTINVIATASSGSAVVYPWPSDTLSLTVHDPNTVTSVVVSPSSAIVTDDPFEDLYVQFSATAYNQGGQPVAATFNWSIDDEFVAKLNPTGEGLVQGWTTGITTVRASVDGVTGTATVKVQCGKPAGTHCLHD